MENRVVLEYLNEISFQLALPSFEKERIETSIKAIREKLIVTFFDFGLKQVATFGSFDRNTFLSRKVDEGSDVDILLVFDKKRWEAQTYLNKLKQFANDNYPRSDSYQDHPTIVIELNYIKFELIPCIYEDAGFLTSEKYRIPQKVGADIEWVNTIPNELKNMLSDYENVKEVLLGLIRLFKYWNLCNQKAYKSFVLEKFVIEYFDSDEKLDYNFFRIIDKLKNVDDLKGVKEINDKIRDHKDKIRHLLEKGMEDYVLIEMKKFIPELKS